MHIYGSFCHSRESGNPGDKAKNWIPDQVGNDRKTHYSPNSNYDNCATVTRGEKKHPDPNIAAKAVCYTLRLIKKDMAFEIYDSPNNVSMVIIRPGLP